MYIRCEAFTCIRGLFILFSARSRFQYLIRADPIYDRHTWRKPGSLKLRLHASGIPPPPLPLSLFHGKWPLSFLPSPVSKLSKFPFEKVCSGSRWDRTHPSLDHTPSPFLKHLSGNRSSSSLPKGISILFSFLEWKYWEDRNIPCWYLRIFIDRYRNRRGLLLSHSWYFGI